MDFLGRADGYLSVRWSASQDLNAFVSHNFCEDDQILDPRRAEEISWLMNTAH